MTKVKISIFSIARKWEVFFNYLNVISAECKKGNSGDQ